MFVRLPLPLLIVGWRLFFHHNNRPDFRVFRIQRQPFLKSRLGVGLDRIDGTFRLAHPAIDAFVRMDDEHVLALVEAVHGARLLLASNRQAIPILVESAQWQNLINLTLPNILNAALLQLMPEAGRLTNTKIFQLLVREQLLVSIFDGFDELCSHPNSNYNPTTLIAELVDLVGDAGARILITTRETFWEKFGLGIAEGKG